MLWPMAYGRGTKTTVFPVDTLFDIRKKKKRFLHNCTNLSKRLIASANLLGSGSAVLGSTLSLLNELNSKARNKFNTWKKIFIKGST